MESNRADRSAAAAGRVKRKFRPALGGGKLRETVLHYMNLAEERIEASGAEKRAWVVDRVADELDALLVFPEGWAGEAAEAVDGPIIRALLHEVVQAVYDAALRSSRRD